MTTTMNKKHPICTSCPFNGTGSDECLKCAAENETYSYKYQQYLLDGYNPPQPDTSTSEPATDLDEDTEDTLRKMLFAIFDLHPLHLLLLQGIMRGKTLTQFANETNKLIEDLHKRKDGITKFSAFQMRKAMLKKNPTWAKALTTALQKKPLKV